MDEALEGTRLGADDGKIEHIPDEHRVRRQVIAPHMAAKRSGVESLYNFPSVFEFQSKYGRAESIHWEKYATPAQTLAHGEKQAEKKRAEKLAKTPDLGEEQLPLYAGYLEGLVGLIRAEAYKDVATSPGEIRCYAGLYSVVHLPENGDDAHGHIVLSEDYFDVIKQQMAVDGKLDPETMTKKLAFPAAIQILLATFEQSGFFCHDGTHLKLGTAA